MTEANRHMWCAYEKGRGRRRGGMGEGEGGRRGGVGEGEGWEKGRGGRRGG